MKKIFIIFFILLAIKIYGDSYSGSSENEAIIVRAPLWVFLEKAPGNFNLPDDSTKDTSKEKFIPPKQALYELSKYILPGMTYGFKFSYTPPYKKHKVKEFFELKPIATIKLNKENIRFSDIKIEYPYCSSWIEYRISEEETFHFKFWTQNIHKTIKGTGHGNRFDELEGVYAAYNDAIKNAVTKYAKSFIKNRPKEINGTVLIKSNPRLYVQAGYFKVDISVYINIDEIIKYEVF